MRRGLVRVGGRLQVDTPKSAPGVRDVAIPPHLIDRFRDHLTDHVGATGPTPCCFHPETNETTWLQPKSLYNDFHLARAAAYRQDLRWHDLRHTGAVLAAATGATLAELMARLGHSSPGAALGYQHAAQARDKAIADAMSKLV